MKFREYLDSPSHWLRRASLATQHAISDSFSEHNLSSAQYEVLGQLWIEDGLEQRTIQERLSVTSATLTGVIDGLVERGLVERRISPADARVKQVYISDAGRALEQSLGEKTERIQHCLLHGFSPAEIVILKEWLKRMTQNISSNSETS